MIPRSGLARLTADYWSDAGREFGGLLVDNDIAYVPSVEGDEWVADVTAAEVAVTGYERAVLSGVTATWDSGNARWRLVCSNPTFGSPETGTDVRGWWLYEQGTDDTDSPLLAWLPFDDPEPSDGDLFTATVDAEGVLRNAEAT